MKPTVPILFRLTFYSTLLASCLSDTSEKDMNDFWEWCVQRGIATYDSGISVNQNTNLFFSVLNTENPISNTESLHTAKTL